MIVDAKKYNFLCSLCLCVVMESQIRLPGFILLIIFPANSFYFCLFLVGNNNWRGQLEIANILLIWDEILRFTELVKRHVAEADVSVLFTATWWVCVFVCVCFVSWPRNSRLSPSLCVITVLSFKMDAHPTDQQDYKRQLLSASFVLLFASFVLLFSYSS